MVTCDVKGCRKHPYVEVFKTNHSWSYLCKKHYEEEYKKHGNKFGWYELTTKERIFLLLGITTMVNYISKIWWNITYYLWYKNHPIDFEFNVEDDEVSKDFVKYK